MTTAVLGAARRRNASAVVAPLLVLLVSICGDLQAAAASVPTVGDYVVRVVRAMGLEGQLPRNAPPKAYLEHLVARGVVSAESARSLRLDAPLTRDVALRLSQGFGRSPAPAFLSDGYLAVLFLADRGGGAGLINPATDDKVLDLFNASIKKPQHNCPTPRKKRPRPCPPKP